VVSFARARGADQCNRLKVTNNIMVREVDLRWNQFVASLMRMYAKLDKLGFTYDLRSGKHSNHCNRLQYRTKKRPFWYAFLSVDYSWCSKWENVYILLLLNWLDGEKYWMSPIESI
jgi:hypothetical protein